MEKNTNATLARDAFFAAIEAASPKTEIVAGECPELGGDINIKILTAGEIEDIDRRAKGDFDRAILIVYESVMDQDGHKMFTSRSQVAALKSPVFTALSQAVGKASKIDLEAMAKN